MIVVGVIIISRSYTLKKMIISMENTRNTKSLDRKNRYVVESKEDKNNVKEQKIDIIEEKVNDNNNINSTNNTDNTENTDNTDNTEPISAEIATFIAEIDCPHFVNVATAAFYGFLCVGQTLAT